MIEVLDYKAEHLEQMREQESMLYLRPYISDQQRKELEKSDMAYTGKVNGRVVFCAGVVSYWPGRGEAWAVLENDCRKEFYAIHRIVHRFLEVCPLRRIEATVDYDFKPGHRWAKMLGFEVEAPRLKGYMPDGRDSVLYALVRDR